MRMIAAAGMLCIGVLASACESTPVDRNEVIAEVNASRAEAGLPPLRENLTLDRKADAWAQRLRDSCSLSHSKLSDGAPEEWMKLGENVGYGGTIAQVHDAYMNSPGHRANILDPSFTSMGAAAVWGTCPDGTHRVFTVHEFMHT
ncbi:MAG: transporter [Microthrixaceae bacterium]|nr:transporter [Microthrixaceae bacterium]